MPKVVHHFRKSCSLQYHRILVASKHTWIGAHPKKLCYPTNVYEYKSPDFKRSSIVKVSKLFSWILRYILKTWTHSLKLFYFIIQYKIFSYKYLLLFLPYTTGTALFFLVSGWVGYINCKFHFRRVDRAQLYTCPGKGAGLVSTSHHHLMYITAEPSWIVFISLYITGIL